jgi:hypothetical protein
MSFPQIVRLVLVGLAGLCAVLSLHAAPLKFVYPPPESTTDQRHLYYWQLLEAALEANRDKYGDFRLMPYPIAMSFQRAAAEVEIGKGRVNIVARATNLDLERRLRPIPLPLDKGLLGYRIFLATPETAELLKQVKTLDDLRALSIGQAVPWTDVPILQEAGFHLVLSEYYEPLFGMLASRRFDVFPRGVNEVQAEWEAQVKKFPNLVIDRQLVLAYPMPRYFFVPRTEEGERMAERIEDGLKRLVRSGQFDRMYSAYKREVLRGVELSGRRVFRLPNPQLSPLAPKDRVWWDDLEAELRPATGPKR